MTAADAPTIQDPRDELVEHLPALRAFALSLTRNRASADDLVQDAIVKAWQNMDKFKPGTNLRAWLFTILRNLFYSSRRKSKREVQDSDGAMMATLSEKPEHDGRLAMADFETAFAKLNDEQREALILVGASGFSYEEAAGMTGVAGRHRQVAREPRSPPPCRTAASCRRRRAEHDRSGDAGRHGTEQQLFPLRQVCSGGSPIGWISRGVWASAWAPFSLSRSCPSA